MEMLVHGKDLDSMQTSTPKVERIAKGSGEKMRKPGTKGAPKKPKLQRRAAKTAKKNKLKIG